jgi:hypothetical protein
MYSEMMGLEKLAILVRRNFFTLLGGTRTKIFGGRVLDPAKKLKSSGKLLASLPIYYLAFWVQTGPTAVPLVTFSNGQKNVVFQGMQHVASEDFYKSVVFDLEKALVDGYTLFYEGVHPIRACLGCSLYL